jgi:hypothetical protein
MSHIVDFKAAIACKRKIRLTFISQATRQSVTHTCAPLDFGPNPTSKDQIDIFHVWDYENELLQHEISFYPNCIQKIEVLIQTFDPKEVVTSESKPKWHYRRNWGNYS